MLSSPRISPDTCVCGCAVVSTSVAWSMRAGARLGNRRKTLRMCRSLFKQPVRLGPVRGVTGSSRGGHWVQSGGALGPVEGVTGSSRGGHWVQSRGSLGPVVGVTGSSRGGHWVQSGGSLGPVGGVTGSSRGGHWVQSGGGTGCRIPWNWSVEGGALHRGAMDFEGVKIFV